jgi:dipeptidyl aminopeptidase/acylaminoacyl peptidase
VELRGIAARRVAFIHVIGLFVMLAPVAQAQNGRIVDQQTFGLDNSVANELRETSPETLAAIQQVETKEITYVSDGLKVKGFLLVPKKDVRYPVLIFNRGGCKDFGVLTRAFVARWLSVFASWGYVVVASQYRGNGGGEGKDQLGGDDVNDVLNLLPLIDSLPNADPTRIGMWGASRGGLMSYLILTRTNRIRAAVILSGPTNLSTISAYRKALRPDDDFEEFCLREAIPRYDRNKQKELEARSPIKWPEKLNRGTPILLFQGTSDWRSSPQSVLDMAAALLKLKHPFRLVMLEGGEHELDAYLEEVDRITRNWLDWYVRDKKTWPSLEPHGN